MPEVAAAPTIAPKLELPTQAGGASALPTTTASASTQKPVNGSDGLLSAILSVFGISHFNDLTININAGASNVQTEGAVIPPIN